MQVTATLASALFGASAAGSANAGDAASSLAVLKAAEAPGATAKGVARERKAPVTIAALNQFQAAIARAKDVKTALQDPRVLNVLLPALGLADQAAYPGLVQKALTADPKDRKGLLASLDKRFAAAATTLDLKARGFAGLKDAKVQQTLMDGFVEYQYRTGLDEKNAGISDALYFLQNAKGQTNIYSILGNSVMRRVITGALGLPSSIVVQPVETQAAAITSRLKLSDLNDPEALEKLAQRYVIAAAGSGSGGAASPLLSLLA
jgi:hypothetical protein